MFTSIFQNLSTAVAEMLDCIVSAFLTALNLDMSMYLTLFPLLSTVYSILQGLAVGMTAILALSGLATFWLGAVDSSAMSDRPVSILLRSLMAGMLVYFGGHFLSMCVDLGTIPYELFLNMDGATEQVSALSFAGSLLQGAASIAVAPTYAVKDVTVALIEFLIIVLIAINLFKLTLEVAERYMVVGLLVFTSPIVYSTLATKSSSRIMKNWISMFAASLIMMSASVLFLKLVVNGLNNAAAAADSDSAAYLLRILLVLALCRIAQRVDNYLQQLGFSVATTGGNILDDILSLGSVAAKAFNGASRGSSGILGTMTSYASHTPLGQGLKAATTLYASGMSAKDAFTEGKKATAAGYKNTVWGNAPAAAQKAASEVKKSQSTENATWTEKVKTTASAAKAGASAFTEQLKADGVRGAAEGMVRGVVHAFNPEMVEKHHAAQDQQAAEERRQSEVRQEEMGKSGRESQSRTEQTAPSSYGYETHKQNDSTPAHDNAFERDKKNETAEGTTYQNVSPEESLRYPAECGVTDTEGHIFHRNPESGELALSEEAGYAGIRINPETNTMEAPSGAAFSAGMAAALADISDAEYTSDTKCQKWENEPKTLENTGFSGNENCRNTAQTVVENSVRSMTPETAMETLQEPHYTLSGRENAGPDSVNYVLETAKTAFRGSVPQDMDQESTRITSFRSENIPNVRNEEGKELRGGRAYTLEYSNAEERRSVTYMDGTAFATLSRDEQREMRRFVNEGGMVLWYRATDGNDKDIFASRRGKERKPSGYRGSGIGKKKEK